MKKLIVEESGEGLLKLMGKRVTLFYMNYIYTGDLIGVNDSCVLLSNAQIVYETGPLDSGSIVLDMSNPSSAVWVWVWV